ncbi:MAG: universal stress protein [Chloroflexi bacterium]|nr:universal stress protein [Chloroflexota bacterium]
MLRVLTPSHLAIETYAMEQLLANVEEMERDGRGAYLRQLLVKLAPEGLTITTQTAVGPAADVIIDTAANQGFDLIAMCSHGRSGISRWVYGSVTEKECCGSRLRHLHPARQRSSLGRKRPAPIAARGDCQRPLSRSLISHKPGWLTP